MVGWLFGIPSARNLGGDVYEIQITGYGPADVGPYDELRTHVGTNSGLECHHIVEREHLHMIRTSYSAHNAPSVAIPRDLHRSLVSARFTAEHNALGGRSGGIATVTKRELLELYKQVYTWHMPFRELYKIAQQILM